MKKLIILVAALPVLITSGVALLVADALQAVIASAPTAPTAPSVLSGQSPLGIPAAMVRIYAAAASTCPGLSWAVPAAIGTVESNNGLSTAVGVHSGANSAGAEGPMQFEPATFAAYEQPVPPGGMEPPSPYDPIDAVYAAVRMLCADRAADPSQLSSAIWDYNHSAAYVARVLELAYGYGYQGTAASASSADAVDYSLAQLGVPYRWGGASPGLGFDCSGLAQTAWSVAGIDLPRTAQAQFEAGPKIGVESGAQLKPGDLVFFGGGPSSIGHVGIVVDAGLMVDAPHTGADVRVEPFPSSFGAAWGGEILVGATDPGRSAPAGPG